MNCADIAKLFPLFSSIWLRVSSSVLKQVRARAPMSTRVPS